MNKQHKEKTKELIEQEEREGEWDEWLALLHWGRKDITNNSAIKELKILYGGGNGDKKRRATIPLNQTNSFHQ